MILKPIVVALGMIAMLTAAAAQDDEDDAPSLDDTPHITIVGTASTEVAPDLATVTLGVKSRKAQAMAAADAVAVTSKSVIDAAKAMGVGAADIATRSVSLQQSFEEVRDPQGHVTGTKPSGFEASNAVAIRIRDLAKAGQIAQTLIDKGANSFDGVIFTVEHPQPIQDRLDADATANARRQAEAIATAAGAKLGRVLLIVRPGSAVLPSARTFSTARARVAAAPAEMPLEAGTTSFAAQVEVTWALEK